MNTRNKKEKRKKINAIRRNPKPVEWKYFSVCKNKFLLFINTYRFCCCCADWLVLHRLLGRSTLLCIWEVFYATKRKRGRRRRGEGGETHEHIHAHTNSQSPYAARFKVIFRSIVWFSPPAVAWSVQCTSSKSIFLFYIERKEKVKWHFLTYEYTYMPQSAVSPFPSARCQMPKNTIVHRVTN